MPKKEVIAMEGTIQDALPNAMFLVELTNGHKVLAHLAGKVRIISSRSCPATGLRSSCRRTISREAGSPGACGTKEGHA